ncbi:oxygen-dependent protoporphyrinogen oxidase [Pleurotus pulmonarius]|nr:oxygen-dependent protoporphyrinogen oxidase [Pleurotus pulmonarius]
MQNLRSIPATTTVASKHTSLAPLWYFQCAAGVDVEPIWATLLAKALEGKNVKELLSNVGSGGGAPAAAPAGGAAAGAAAAEAPKEEEKKEEEKEESDDDMVCRAFPPVIGIIKLTDARFLPVLRASVSSIDLFLPLSCTYCMHHHITLQITSWAWQLECVGTKLAILGGGLSGLSAAFHLLRRFPNALITIIEKHNKLGGWAQSDRIDVKDERGQPCSVLLESGPRTLRPNADSVLELIHLLGLKDSLVLTPRSAAAARKRFLYIYGTKGLTPLPSSVAALVSSPLRSLFVRAGLRDTFIASESAADESVHSFLSRNFGEDFALTLGSALVHGIYAADSRKLSVRAAFPTLCEAEKRGRGRVIAGSFLSSPTTTNGYDLGDMKSVMDGVSVYSFRDGLSTITNALQAHLASKPNVRMLLGTGVSRLSMGDAVEVTMSTGERITPTHVVSALPLPQLQPLLASSPLPHLDANPSSSVKVANFVFPSSSRFHPDGFGYLIPRSKAGYENPENPGILGTVFDSCSLAEQDRPSPAPIKVTMMLGGPYGHVDIPESTLLSHLASHVRGVRLPKLLYSRIQYHQDCIPTFTPGHLERMGELRRVLREGPWKGRLEVIGAGVGGVSVGDCVEAGRNAGVHWQ